MDDLEKVVIQHTEQIKTLFSRVDQQERMMESINDLTLSVKELALQQGQMQKDVAGLQGDVEVIKQKPAKKWEDVSSKVLWAILAAVIGLVLGKFGL
jgi:hypothetical protein